MKIKMLTQEDWEIWKSFRLEALKNSPESFGSSYEEELNWPDSDFQNSLTKSDIFGVFVDQSLASCAGFYSLNSAKTKHRGFLWGMYTKAEYRGQGIASALIQTIINHAKARVIQLHLTCVTSNLDAIKLYEKHGFEIYGTEPHSFKIGKRFFDECLMVLRLSPRSQNHINYDKFREAVYGDIRSFDLTEQVYHSFVENIYHSEELAKKISSRTPNILSLIKNALLSHLYVILRRILSVDKKDSSLCNLYKYAFDEKRHGFLLQVCLPNSHDKYRQLKKYINKTVAHADLKQAPLEEDFSWQDIESILEDLKNTFNRITLKKEDATYEFDKKDARHLADDLFKKMASF